MKEHLLHFMWKMQLFSTVNLCGVAGEKIEIVDTGSHNENTGPDFLNARIRIDGTLLVGHVEIHVNSSDWYLHKHERDPNYEQVILHVVWYHTVDVFCNSNIPVVTLSLRYYVSEDLLDKHRALFSKGNKWINCENEISEVAGITLINWMERLFFERLEQKAAEVDEILVATNNHWEASCFVILARNFGLKINAEVFKQMALSFNFNIIGRIRNNPILLESLFFGRAGLLGSSEPVGYEAILKGNYDFLCKKFSLHEIHGNSVQFFRLRPGNFPTLRLSQLAVLYASQEHLFSKIMSAKTKAELYEIFQVCSTSFWETHYTFQTVSKKYIKKVSKSFIDLLIINSMLPLKLLYIRRTGNQDITPLIELMRQLKPEKNKIINGFKNLEVSCDSALESQALLQLKNNYCDHGKCLSCTIGVSLLRS